MILERAISLEAEMPCLGPRFDKKHLLEKEEIAV